MSTDIKEILKEYWGYDSFRPMQEEVVRAVLDGNDTLAILPTGGGKSICFQVPAMAVPGLCLVVSPLIALIRDQVENLKKKGIPALAIYSGMKYHDILKTLRNATYGPFKFLYVSPERLETELFQQFISQVNINLVAIDEAHCISQWGYDFRPSYLRIAALREMLPNITILALTASATRLVQTDICEKLLFREGYKHFQKSFERPNLSYSVFKAASKQTKLIEILSKVKGQAIVYCKTRKRTTEVAALMNMHGMNADFYHAGLDNDKRSAKQQRWITNQTRVIASTNAFGMGIDKPDVRVVVHYDVPDCLENYYQEAGRAGRDELKAYAVLLYNELELNDLLKQVDTRFPSLAEIKNVYKSLMNYLQLPAGTGEEQSFDFDLVDFAKKFKLDAFQALYAIKALEQEGLLNYNEQFYSPSVVVFTSSRTQLELYEKVEPAMGNIIKGLLRSYEGIFDYPAEINEANFASFLKISIVDLTVALRNLCLAGIIDYTTQRDKPQISLSENRVTSSQLVINYTGIHKRKKAFEDRLQMMIKFTHAEDECRSQLIGNYFGDHALQPCGVCDNCLRQKNTSLTGKEFEQLSFTIKNMSAKGTVDINEVLNASKPVSKEKVWKVINYLIAEQQIEVSEMGKIKHRKI